MIHKLPQHLINKLKAWEIVERPASVVKELIENSLDAEWKNINIEILDWWKKLIKVEDDGIWISKEDLPLTIERYATSKINSEEDLERILTYWFRWEALAAISEVSKFKIQSKIEEGYIWYELVKVGKTVSIKPFPFPKEHWTIVYVEDIFYNVPVRRKYLKSKQTEEKYIRQTIINFALSNYNIWFKFISDKKVIFNFSSVDSLFDRIKQIYGEDIVKNLKPVENYIGEDWQLKVYWFVSDSSLTFSSSDNMIIFVNKRPIQDKLLKKAVMQAYYRQIAPNEYPFVLLFLEINPNLVDVNVHPRKLEVKFKDPGSVFNFVYNSLISVFEENKINIWVIKNFDKEIKNNFKINNLKNQGKVWLNLDFSKKVVNQTEIAWEEKNQDKQVSISWFNLKIIWQLWNTYILLEDNENLYIVDQHALAERIIFEKLRDEVLRKWLNPKILFTPVSIEISNLVNDLDEKIKKLNKWGFDVWLLWENKLVLYAVPEVLEKYKIDLKKLIFKLLTLERIDLNIILDEIWATKACKAAIKAWDKLSYLEMKKLIEDWFEYIKWQFVCQHGRPSFVKIDKENIEKLFDR